VLSLFVAESVLLSLLSTIAGTICAFGAMKLLSLITIDASENPLGMILVNSHLFFAPNPLTIGFFIVSIAGITALTAFFPARRASRISAANAMRHYE
jgi:ABC-type lipoprotein release transport system permease subunit